MKIKKTLGSILSGAIALTPSCGNDYGQISNNPSDYVYYNDYSPQVDEDYTSNENPLGLTPVNPTPVQPIQQNGEVTIYATEDTYVSMSSPLSNYGNEPNLLSGQTSLDRYTAFVKFDVSRIPYGARVVYASLGLETGFNNTAKKPVDNVTISSVEPGFRWNEHSVDYTNSPTISYYQTSKEVVFDTNERIHFDITSAVQGWVDGNENNGLVVKTRNLDVVSAAGFYSSEQNGRGPDLFIRYKFED